MKKILLAGGMFLILFSFLGTSLAQVPSVGVPLKLDLGFGGGPSVPLGSLKDVDNTGFNIGAKARLHGSIPVNFAGLVSYNRLSNKFGTYADFMWSLGAGIEYPFPLPEPIVKPYLAGDLLFTSLSNTAPGTSSVTRTGIGVGGGVEFSLVGISNLDASLKYQVFNLAGKNAGEVTRSQVALNISIMFGII